MVSSICIYMYTVGAVVGTVTGAVTGQTTETGLVRGAGIGALAGAVISMDVLDGICNGESLSKVLLLASIYTFLNQIKKEVL